MQIGAYAVEKDYSHYVAYAAKTIFAVVGTASKGPIGVPTVCTTAQDLVNKFGSLDPKHIALYAGQYFLSQSSKLYFVRAAAAATVTVTGTESSGDVNSVVFTACEVDTDMEGFTLEVKTTQGGSHGNGEEDTPFVYDFTIKDKSGQTIEEIKNVECSAGAGSLFPKFKSNYIEYKELTHPQGGLNDGTYTFARGTKMDAADYINAAKSLAADQIDMNLFAVPGVSDPAVVTAMLTLAETRGDCLYLIDPPADLTRDGVVQWRKGGEGYEHSAFNSSYGALYYDWVTIYDSVNKQRVNVPPSVVVAPAYAYSDRTTELWYAPAGLNRGLLRGVLDSVTKLSKPDTEYLYDEGINAIYDDPQVGLVIWGQKTLYSSATALDRVNVRRLLNYLKRVVTAACNYLTFEPNDRITWNSFDMKIRPVLENLKNKRGIYEYRLVKGNSIVTNEDIDNYRMPCMIMIRPTKAAEEIPIYFTITSTGADFNEVLEANGVVITEDI